MGDNDDDEIYGGKITDLDLGTKHEDARLKAIHGREMEFNKEINSIKMDHMGHIKVNVEALIGNKISPIGEIYARRNSTVRNLKDNISEVGKNVSYLRFKNGRGGTTEYPDDNLLTNTTGLEPLDVIAIFDTGITGITGVNIGGGKKIKSKRRKSKRRKSTRKKRKSKKKKTRRR